MRKLQITAIGEPTDVLELVEFQAPAPSPGQVLVEVQAATINASDFLYVSGQYFITPQPPSDVGAEGVGRVVAVGPGENESLLGSRVLLLPTYRHGTWATHLIADTTDIAPKPHRTHGGGAWHHEAEDHQPAWEQTMTSVEPHAITVWDGDLTHGTGRANGASGALAELPVTYKSRIGRPEWAAES